MPIISLQIIIKFDVFLWSSKKLQKEKKEKKETEKKRKKMKKEKIQTNCMIRIYSILTVSHSEQSVCSVQFEWAFSGSDRFYLEFSSSRCKL